MDLSYQVKKIKKILVVDDEEEIRLLLSKFLKRQGFDVETACDGHDALLKMKIFKADLILSDILMPVCDGYDFIKKLEVEFKPQPLLFFISGYMGTKMNELKNKTFVKGFMEKPIKINTLLDQIKELDYQLCLSLENPPTDSTPPKTLK